MPDLKKQNNIKILFYILLTVVTLEDANVFILAYQKNKNLSYSQLPHI